MQMNLKKFFPTFSNNEIFENLIFFLLLFCSISISFISNYKPYSLLLKIFSSLFLFFYFCFKYAKSNKSIRLKSYNLLPLLLFITWTALTLTYTPQQAYGFQKFLHFIIVIIPLGLSVVYIHNFFDKERYKLFIFFLGVTVAILDFLAITLNPFQFGSAYAFEFSRWSHVVFSRIVAISFILFLLGEYHLRFFKKQSYLFIFILLHLTALLVAGHRIVLVGTLIFLAIYFFHYRLNKIKIVGWCLGILLIVFVLSQISPSINERFIKFIYTPWHSLENDASFMSRLDAWKIAWDIFIANPIAGIGLGGFNQYASFEITTMMKYPHNIFLEVLCELGLIGFSLFILLLFQATKFSSAKNKVLLPLLIFLLFLSLFAKDIPSNAVFFAVAIGQNIRIMVQQG